METSFIRNAAFSGQYVINGVMTALLLSLFSVQTIANFQLTFNSLGIQEYFSIDTSLIVIKIFRRWVFRNIFIRQPRRNNISLNN